MINYKLYLGFALFVCGILIAINSVFIATTIEYGISSQPISTTDNWCSTYTKISPNYDPAFAAIGCVISLIGGVIASVQLVKSKDDTNKYCPYCGRR